MDLMGAQGSRGECNRKESSMLRGNHSPVRIRVRGRNTSVATLSIESPEQAIHVAWVQTGILEPPLDDAR